MRAVFLFAAALGALIGWPGGVAADDTAILYRGAAIVTGTGEENRQIGFRLAMEDVVVRVSGDYRLVESGKAKATIDGAAAYVARFSYRDLYEGRPVHDEQGTHDRPHELTVDFQPGKVDAALASLGSKPWLGERPRLTMILGVKNAKGRFVLSSDAEQGFYMRDSLTASSKRIAVPVVLPSQALIGASGLREETLAGTEMAALDAVARAAGGDRALAGTLTWSDAERGWIAEWRLTADGRTNAWRISGVSFDDAFRNALRGAAQVLSGNGAPQS